MMKALTYKQYRIINIALLTLIFIFIETAVTRGANEWFTELPYVLSLGIMFVSLEMMRWGIWAIPADLAAGLTLCLASGAGADQFIIYMVGDLAMLAALIFIKKVGGDRIRSDAMLTALYVLIVFILAQLGRSAVAIAMGSDLRIVVQFVTTDALSGLFAEIVILLARRVDGIFENQYSYLRRLETERRQEQEDTGY